MLDTAVLKSFFGSIFDKLKILLEPKVLMLFSLPCITIVLMRWYTPEEIIVEAPELKKFLIEYWMYALIIVFLGASWLITEFVMAINARWKRWQHRRLLVRRAKELTPFEWDVIRQFSDTDRISVDLEYNNGIVISLEKKGFIFRASSTSRHGTFFSYIIPEDVRRLIKSNKILIPPKPENSTGRTRRPRR